MFPFVTTATFRAKLLKNSLIWASLNLCFRTRNYVLLANF